MSYLFFAWVASIVFGLEVLIGKLTSKYSVENPWLLNFIWSFFIIVLIAPFAVVNNVGWPVMTKSFLLTSVFYALANILYIISLKLMDVTAFGPLFHFRTVFSVILGVIMLGEVITPVQIGLIAFIFVLGVISNIDESMKIQSFFKPAIAIVLGFLFILALMGIYTNLAIAEQGYWKTTFWSMVVAQGLFFFTIPLFWKDIKKTDGKSYGSLLLMSMASAGATMAANVAYASNVGITSAILSLPFSMVMTIAIAFIWPKLLERHNSVIYAIRMVAAMVMMIAALNL